MMFILTEEQCDLIADALDVVNPDEEETAEKARALAYLFRNRYENV
jgi:hypothetical protein